MDYRDYLAIDEKLYRPSEVKNLQGNPSKAQNKIEWYPTVSFEKLVKKTVDADRHCYSVYGPGSELSPMTIMPIE